jgi:hypothetical protein
VVFPPHRWGLRVLHLEPVARPTARVARAAPFADAAFAAKLARVLEHDRLRPAQELELRQSASDCYTRRFTARRLGFRPTA